MRSILLSFAISISLFSQSQQELNETAYKEYLIANRKMNETFGKILKLYAKDKNFITAAKTSQKKWIEYRNADLNMRFPSRTNGYYGSMAPVCKFWCLTALTEGRTTLLEKWLEASDPEDLCNGSFGKWPDKN